MMTKFEKALEEVFFVEGGYSNDPDDKGGETNLGITKDLARDWGYEGAMEDLGTDTAKEIYFDVFWDNYDLSDFELIIGKEVFEQAVNMGPKQAIKHLQKSYKLLTGNGIVVDGIMGSNTKRAINSYSYPNKIVAILNGFQFNYYKDIVEDNPSQRKFLWGWVNKRVKIGGE